jgi:WD40 repeat protein
MMDSIIHNNNNNANIHTTPITTTTTATVNRHSLQIGGPLNALSPSPDGSMIAVGGRTVYRIVKIAPHTNQLSMHIPIRVGKKNMNYGVVDLKWHPLQSCANLIATAPTNGKVILWNIHSNNSVKLGMLLLLLLYYCY